MTDLAVLMIDVQNGYIADDHVRDGLGWPPIWRLNEVLGECAALLHTARARSIPIVYSRAARTPTLTAAQSEWRRQIIDTVRPRTR